VSGDRFTNAVAQIGPALLRSLAGLEHAERHLHPPEMARVREALGTLADELDEARAALRGAPPPPELADLAVALTAAGDHAYEALSRFVDPAGDVGRVLQGMHFHHRAEAALYPLRRALPPVSRFFVEQAFADRLDELDPDDASESSGLHDASNAPDQRGGFSLYVPESFREHEPMPLIVALHGGSGHGADFLWSWLREARSRRCLLLAPTSQRSTWSLMGPDIDTPQLLRMIDFVADHWPLDRERMLLTGLSDGATFSLLSGLLEDSPFSAIAPASGVLHPMNFRNGNMERAHHRRIYLVHGALDWMFPIQTARAAAEELEKAGADLQFHEVADLSHTYPREHNARILDWMGV
jgi:phospholipase/carboxylesterase